MKKITKVGMILILLISLLTLVACGGTADNGSEEKKTLKIGTLSLFDPICNWIKDGLAEEGYEVEIIMFDANQLPATALSNGELDMIIANHKPWMETFNKENGSDLAMVEPYYCYGFFAIYSDKHDSLDAIPDGGKIAIGGDPTNMNRSLLMLQDAGLIKLNEDKTEAFYTIMDVKENPKNLSFIETEVSQTPRSIADVDAMVSSAYLTYQVTGMDPTDNLYEDKTNKDYPLGLIVQSKDKDSKWAKAAMDYLLTDTMTEKLTEEYHKAYKLF